MKGTARSRPAIQYIPVPQPPVNPCFKGQHGAGQKSRRSPLLNPCFKGQHRTGQQSSASACRGPLVNPYFLDDPLR